MTSFLELLLSIAMYILFCKVMGNHSCEHFLMNLSVLLFLYIHLLADAHFWNLQKYYFFIVLLKLKIKKLYMFIVIFLQYLNYSRHSFKVFLLKDISLSIYRPKFNICLPKPWETYRQIVSPNFFQNIWFFLYIVINKNIVYIVIKIWFFFRGERH